jgi:hypothetical protein
MWIFADTDINQGLSLLEECNLEFRAEIEYVSNPALDIIHLRTHVNRN